MGGLGRHPRRNSGDHGGRRRRRVGDGPLAADRHPADAGRRRSAGGFRPRDPGERLMNLLILDPLLILVLLLNFAILATSSLRIIIFTVAAQGFVLAALYPIAHGNVHVHPEGAGQIWDLARLYGLTAVMGVVKGIIIPWLLLKAMREADVPHQIDPIGGLTPTLIVAAIGTALTII